MRDETDTIDAKRRKVLLGLAAGATYVTPALLSFSMQPAHASGVDGVRIVTSNTVVSNGSLTKLDEGTPTVEDLLQSQGASASGASGAVTSTTLVSGNAEALYVAQGGTLAEFDVASKQLRKVGAQPPRGAVDIAASDISLFVVGTDGTMWKTDLGLLRANRSAWLQVSGLASRVFVSPKFGNGQREVWHLSQKIVSAGGYNMYRMQGSGWAQVPGQATEIAFEGARQAVWHGNAAGRMYRAAVAGNTVQGWSQVAGEASQVVSSDNGVVWHLSRSTDANGDHFAYMRSGSGWRRQSNFAAKRIMPASQSNQLWVLKNSGILKVVSV